MTKEVQLTLLPPRIILPYPPRHHGFIGSTREVPGYTIEQMMEFGLACIAEFKRQNK